MSERQKLNPFKYTLNDEERARIFRDSILSIEVGELKAVKLPSVVYIGGQPGSGKSTIGSHITAELAVEESLSTVAVINNDLYRRYHPRYEELCLCNEETASFYTNEDCKMWIDQALDHVFERRSHILLESSLRRPQEVLDTIARGHNVGFSSTLYLVVCNQLESRLSVATRYLDMIDQLGWGRYVLSETQQESYTMIPASLETLTGDENGFDAAVLLSRQGDPLYVHHLGEDVSQLRDTYETLRAMPVQDKADILARIEHALLRAKRHGREACVDDLLALKCDAERL